MSRKQKKNKMLQFEKRIEKIEGRQSLILECLKRNGIIVLEAEPENVQSFSNQNQPESTSTSHQQNGENDQQDLQEDVKMHIYVHKHEQEQEVEDHGEESLEDNFVMATYDGTNDIVIESVKLEDSFGNVQNSCGIYQCLPLDDDGGERVVQNNEVVVNGIDEQEVLDQENEYENIEDGDENLEEIISENEYSDIDNIDNNSTEEISILYEQVQNGQDSSRIPKKKKNRKMDMAEDSNMTSTKAKVKKKKLKKCKKCSKTFVLVKKFKIHREICTAKIKCCFIACDKVFKNEEYLRKHQRREHRMSIVDNVKCKFCSNKYFLYKKNMKTHIIEVHQKNHDFPCYICEITFKDKTTALSHIKKFHQKKIEKADSDDAKLNKRKPKIKKIRYKCLKCFACFFDKIAFMNHLKKMRCKRICSRDCILCKRRFRTKKGLVVHTSTVHKDAKKKKIKKSDKGKNSSGKKIS